MSKQIQLADMDVKGKSQDKKSDFDSAIKGNEEIRNMRYHAMTFDELEETFDTNISESK